MNSVFTRTSLLVLHAIASVILLTYIVKFDISGRWLSFVGFVLLLFALMYLLVRHIISYVSYIKTKIK